MVNTKKKTQKKQARKIPGKGSKPLGPVRAKTVGAKKSSLPNRDSASSKPSTQIHSIPQSTFHPDHQGPSIEIRSINGETTIGDLIVAFPRTRDVLMKHGLRFDVEEAGYLYMTLSVFSAIHGHSTTSLVEQLIVVSKEQPPQPSVPLLRPIPAAPNT